MPLQDIFVIFQQQLLVYYQLTRENPAYAVCLGVGVWVVASILYGLSINSLKKRNRSMQNMLGEAQSALAAARAELQQAEETLEANRQQLAEEIQHAAELRERVNEYGTQLRESAAGLAADPELGQQGLTVGDDVSLEHVWQRYDSAVKLVGGRLREMLQANREIQANYENAQTKLAETDHELQTTRIRLDIQKQQIAKLERTLGEQKELLDRQQEATRERIAELEAEHHAAAEKARMLELQVQFSARERPRQVPEKIAVVTPVAEPVPAPSPAAAPAAGDALPVQDAPPESAKPVTVADFKVSEVTKRSEPATGKTAGKDIGGKLKSLFGGRQKSSEINVARPEPPVQDPVPAVAEQQTPSEDADRRQNKGGLFKNVFGSSGRAAKETTAVTAETPAQPIRTESPEPSTPPVSAGAGKFKSMFTNALRTMQSLDQKLGTDENSFAETERSPEREARQTVEPAPSVREPESAPTAGRFGKFKNPFAGGKAVKETAADAGPVADVPLEQSPAQVETTKSGAPLKKLFGKFKRDG